MKKTKLTEKQLKLVDEFYWGVESGRLCPPSGIWEIGAREWMLKEIRRIFDSGEYDKTDKDMLNMIRDTYIENKK